MRVRSTVTALLAFLPCCAATAPAPVPAEVETELLRKADDWLVPQPTAAASLIEVWAFRRGDEEFYSLGFVEPNDQHRALVGLEWVGQLDRQQTRQPGQPLDFDTITCTSPFGAPQGTNFGLVTGIQLLRRGDLENGRTLIAMAVNEDAGHHRSPFRVPTGEPPVTMLARSCLAAAVNEITTAEPDFPAIQRRVKRLLADQPALRSEATGWLLKTLEATVSHQPAPPGTTERLIDDYLLSGSTHGGLASCTGDVPAAERALILAGFDAVPAIIEQLESRRLTNHLMQGFNNFSSFPLDAGQVLYAYLQRLANDEFGSNWLDRQKGITPQQDKVSAWWRKARAIGEEAHVAKHTIRTDPQDRGRVHISNELLLIAADRYPQHLPAAYRQTLKSTTPSWPIAEAISGCDGLSDEDKSALFVEAIATDHEAHRNTGLGHLAELDRQAADRQLTKLLDDSPTTAAEEYWRDQNAGLGGLASQSRDPRVWQALLRLIDRADLGMKMELIDHLGPRPDAPPEIHAMFFSLYDRFAGDKTLRNNAASSKFDGPGAGFPHDRIRMRDFIHLRFKRWMKLELEEPGQNAPDRVWRTFRDQVGEALKQRRSLEPRPGQ